MAGRGLQDAPLSAWYTGSQQIDLEKRLVRSSHLSVSSS